MDRDGDGRRGRLSRLAAVTRRAAAGLLLTFAALLAAPLLGTGGQAQADVLVSNMGQTVLGSNPSISTRERRAQGFMTGPVVIGLSSIEVSLRRAPAAPSDVTVELWSESNGRPGARLHTLTNPGNLSTTGIKTFSAPANTLLADTKYFIVVGYDGRSPTLWLTHTSSDNEDSGARNGWSIDNDHLYKDPAHLSWSSHTVHDEAIRIRINGVVPPHITNVEFISRATHGVNGDTYWLGEHVEVAVTFSGKVQVNPGGTVISLWFGDDFKGAHYHRGSGTDTLVFRYTVQAGDVDADGVFIGAAPIGGSGTVTAAGTDVPATGRIGAQADNPAHKVDGGMRDTTPPALTGAASNGNERILLAFNEALDQHSAPAPAPTAFTVKVTTAGNVMRPTAVTAARFVSNIERNEFVLTVSPRVQSGDGVTVSYTQPLTAARLQDAAGNPVSTFEDVDVTNGPPAAPTAISRRPRRGRTGSGSPGPSRPARSRATGSRSRRTALGSWSILEANTATTDTTYLHTGLAPGTERYYRVSASNLLGFSPPSAVASATTHPAATGAVSRIEIRSNPGEDGVYVAGDDIRVRVHFSRERLPGHEKP